MSRNLLVRLCDTGRLKVAIQRDFFSIAAKFNGITKNFVGPFHFNLDSYFISYFCVKYQALMFLFQGNEIKNSSDFLKIN